MGWIQKPAETEDISGAVRFLWLVSWHFCLLFHICIAHPWLPHLLLTVPASSEHWSATSHHGLCVSRMSLSQQITFEHLLPRSRQPIVSVTVHASAFLGPSSLPRDSDHLCVRPRRKSLAILVSPAMSSSFWLSLDMESCHKFYLFQGVHFYLAAGTWVEAESTRAKNCQQQMEASLTFLSPNQSHTNLLCVN